MPTLVSNLFTPANWRKATREVQARFPSLYTSGVVTRRPDFDEIASGGGLSVNVPVFTDITDQADEIQIENAAPVTDYNASTLQMVGVICNRQTKTSFTAMSKAVSGEDVGAEIVAQVTARRTKQRQATMIALLRGAFGTAAGAALNNAAELAGVRITAADESGNDATAAQIMNPDLFINGKALLGELADRVKFGAFFVHPNVYATLEKADKASFKNGIESGLPYRITTYREVPIFTSELLIRAGTTNGSVYDSYLILPGRFGYGEKAQVLDQIDNASLQIDEDKDKNNELLYDRTRFLMHLNGMRWVGTPANANGGPTNAELQAFANWDLAFSSVNRVGAVCIVTNG